MATLPTSNKRTRNFVFTINNPQDTWGSPEYLIESFAADGGKWIRFGDEICPTTGTPHWQGVCEYKNQRFRDGIIGSTFEWSTGGLGLQPRFGTLAKSITYTGKEAIDGVHEWGGRPGQGTRMDFNELRDRIRAGDNYDQLLDMNPQLAITFRRSILEVIAEREKPYAGVRNVYWNWGVTGAGKTYAAYEAGAVDMSYQMGSWRDYNGEKIVVWDEIDKWDKINWEYMLKLTDVYPRYVQMRNVNKAWRAETIYITSTERPEHVVPSHLWEQMARRIRMIRWFPSKYQAPAAQATSN